MPWYTTADARRDAEKQAAIKKREDTMSYTNEGDGSKVCAGRAMFDAVRAVMFPQKSEK